MLLTLTGVSIILFYRYFSREYAQRSYNTTHCFLFLNRSNNSTTGASLIFLQPYKNYLHIHNLLPELALPTGGGDTQCISNLSPAQAVKLLAETYAIDCKHYLAIDKKSIRSLLEWFGPQIYFNTVNTNFPYDFVAIGADNYNRYLGQIGERAVRVDTEFSLWYNVLRDSITFHLASGGNKKILTPLFRVLDSNLSKQALRYLWTPFLMSPSSSYVSFSHVNVEQVSGNGSGSTKSATVPYQNGAYDARKFKRIRHEFQNVDLSLHCFPLTMQIANTTRHNRLAAKTSGILRLRKCDTKEYLNFRTRLQESVLIDRCGSVAKRSYLMKVTRISNVIYSTSYRDNFDFSVFLGEDYYAIRFLTN
jgi:hypothetical protein